MNTASRPSPLSNAVVTEAIQSIEQAGPLDDASAMREAFVRQPDTAARIAHRAQLLGQRIGLQAEWARARHGAPWVGLGLVLIVVLAGLTLAGSVVGGSERRINIMAALLSLLGLHALTLLAWLAGLLLPMRMPRASLGWVWMALTARVAGGKHGQGAVLLRAAMRLLQRARLVPWAFGLVSHGIWALSFAVVLGALLFALAFHRYTLSWETTILDPQFFVRLVQALGHGPAWFGFAMPDVPSMVDLGAPGNGSASVQRAWALWFTGCIVVYGLLPRLALLLLSAGVWRWRRAALAPDLSTPYFRHLAARFDAMAPATVVDADAGARPWSTPTGTVDTSDALLVVAYELPPEWPWPPAGLPAAITPASLVRTDGGAPSRHALLDAAARLRPRGLLLACRAAASPDRGTERLLRELLTHCGECRLWLMGDAGDDATADTAADNVQRWHRWLADRGLGQVAAHRRLADALAGWCA